MTGFIAALALFIALHIGLAATGLRRGLVRAVGEGPYRLGFSLASVASLAWLVVSFEAARVDPANISLWSPPAALRHVTYLLVTLAFLLGVSGLLTPGPTLAGFEGALNKPDPAKGVLRVTRHPFLWGVALLCIGHLLSNGELAPTLLFGGLGVMVLMGTRSIDKKSAARNPEGWAPFLAATSNVPFAAFLQGRNRFAFGEVWWRLLAAGLLLALVYVAHPLLFGVSPRPV